MCGIAGLLAFDGRPADPRVLDAMGRSLSHRGPDGDGTFREHGVGLAHRRLSILDLAGGAQPMTTTDGDAVIVFNGEIYNFVELRAALEARGHPLATHSDTEVILHLYEEQGPDCVRELRGMFAFALWDRRRRRLVLARDRIGIKPLFYAQDRNGLVFASEIKALLQHPGVPREVDARALGDFLTFQYIPAPRTAFAAIRKLPAAHLLVAEEGRVAIRRYWSLPREHPRRTEAQWEEELRATVDEAVRLHMRSDVPVGALLSGGIDSSLVVAHAAAHADGALRTFTIGFADQGFSEAPFARLVAERYGTKHVEHVLEPQRIDDLPALIGHFDEPFGDPSAIPTSLIAGIAARDVKVCLSGDGGDEGFAGYDAYVTARRLAPADRVPLAARRALLGPIERRVPEWMPGKGFLRFLACDAADRYAEIMGGVDKGTRPWLLHPDFLRATSAEDPYALLRRLHASIAAADETERLQRLDVETYLPDDILVKADRTSMLHSLELRVPLLDHKVLELAFRMPTPLKIQGDRGKAILRRTFADRLPPALLSRGKQGFGLPLAAWLRGDLLGLVRDVFADARTRARGVLDPRGIDRLLTSHLRGRRDLSGEIWLALVLELWFRERVDAPVRAPAERIA
ncbi:MAG TPA: asparagine synthase (glutamine-hydrolyzing) [Candidatus Polarisedimenticolia bacterium]|nr:asparagine synthase (glutamine-hydrolyzing) [Candidatus Polarisedimenticolia bacterium]